MDWFEMLAVPTSDSARVEVTDALGQVMSLTASEAASSVNCIQGGLCVSDVHALARGAGDGETVRALCQLAVANRVLCRAVARRPGCGSGSPTELLAHLNAAGAEHQVVARHGPSGVFAATRAALALGAASAAGLALDPRAAPEAIEVCRRRADEQFRELVKHPDAAGMFRDGAQATVDAKGFRATQPDRVREWLRDQLATVTDRLRLPVPTLLEPAGKTDTQVRHWPSWAVGTKPLAALAGLQDAEYLGSALRSALKDGRVCPKYPNPLAPVSTGPDLDAYRRLRAAGMPACIEPRTGAVFVRVALCELPLALLDAQPAQALAEGLTAATDVALTGEQASTLAALAASGASDAAVAVGLARLAGLAVTHEQAGQLVRALVTRLPALADHLRDPTPERLARHTRATECELAEWTEYARPEPGGEGSLFRSFLESNLTDEFLAIIMPDNRQVLERLRRRHQRPPVRTPEYLRASEPAGPEIDRRRSFYPFIEREVVPTRSGEVIPCTAWVEARAAAAVSAHQVVTGVAFGLVAAGHRVVAVTPAEVLVEVPGDRPGTDAIDRLVAAAVGHFVERCAAPPSAILNRW